LKRNIHALDALAVAGHVRRRPRADVAHHLGVGVEVEEQVRVRLRDVAEGEPVRQERFSHRSFSVRAGDSRRVVGRTISPNE
jgi:hypothetical protein